jgi:hypothetical protein
VLNVHGSHFLPFRSLLLHLKNRLLHTFVLLHHLSVFYSAVWNACFHCPPYATLHADEGKWN